MLCYFVLFCLVFSVHCACPIGFETLGNGDCYRTFTAPSSKQEAGSYCEREGGTLVQPLNAFVDAQIQNEASTFDVSLWLGLTCSGDNPTSCTYSDGDSVTANSYTSFYPGHPNPDVGSCVFLAVSGSQNGRWVSGNCNELRLGFGCQVTAESLLPHHVTTCGSSYQELNGSCYKTISPTTANRAESTCESECGHLTSIHSQQENDFILSSSPPFVTEVRIGLEFSSNRDYEWIDGSIPPIEDYSNFGRNDSNLGDCVAMSLVDDDVTKGKWINTECSDDLPSICKRNRDKPCESFVAPSLPPSTTVIPSLAPPTCDSIFNFRGNGTIYSPGYPSNYSNGLHCEYHIFAMPDQVVFFTINGPVILAFPDDTSDISLYNSYSAKDPFLKRLFYTNDHGNTYYTSMSSSMKVKFVSGSSNKYNWSANFTSVDVRSSGCDQGILRAPGTITSPNYWNALYHGFYPSQLNCAYQLAAPIGKRVSITFADFNVFPDRDLVSVYDGPDANSVLLGNYTDWFPRPTLNSSSNRMFVLFHTDDGWGKHGYTASFTYF